MDTPKGLSEVREVALSWRQAGSNFFPNLAFWQQEAIAIHIVRPSVFVPNEQIDVPEMMEWLKPVSRKNYSLYGRFEIHQHNWRTDRSRHGLRFTFADERDATMFMMRWS